MRSLPNPGGFPGRTHPAGTAPPSRRLFDLDPAGNQRDARSELLCQLEADVARRAEALYRQGLRDGIWLLKYLGVLA